MSADLATDTRAYLESQLDVADVSPLGFLAAGILDEIWGLDNVRRFSSLRTAPWQHPTLITLAVRGPLATFDGDQLTQLIVRGHDACIRIGIMPLNTTNLRLTFSHRDRVGHKHERHPTLEEAIRRVRATSYYGPVAASQAVHG